jgi:hypothetical protein
MGKTEAVKYTSLSNQGLYAMIRQNYNRYQKKCSACLIT